MITTLTLSKFAEAVGMKVSTSSSSGTTSPSSLTGGSGRSSNYNGESVNNTLSKARKNHDVQPLERDSHSALPKKMPSYNMSTRKVGKTSSMSKLEDRRILDRGVNTGAMSTGGTKYF